MRCAVDALVRTAWLAALLPVVALSACQRSTATAELVVVLSAEASVDGEIAAAGDVIPARARLATNDTGVAEFRLERQTLTCQMFPNTEVEIGGPEGPVLRYVSGATVCRVAVEDDRPVLLAARDQSFSVAQAVFRVDLTSADPLVQVSDGDVQVAVSSADGPGDDSTRVPEGRQLPISGPSGTPNSFRMGDLPEDERMAMAQYRESHLREVQVLGERLDEASPPRDESPGEVESPTEVESPAGEVESPAEEVESPAGEVESPMVEESVRVERVPHGWNAP